MTLCYYILDGRQVVPATLHEWALYFATSDRRVAFTKIGQKEISTVFVGIDRRYFSEGPPLVFETMTFDLDGGNGDQTLSSTWAEAEAVHAMAEAQAKVTVIA